MRRLGNESQPIEEFLHDDGGVLPDDHPHVQLYDTVVPLWCDASQDDLDWEVGEGYSCGFATGFEQAIIMCNLHPEWARGYYLRLRRFYPPGDLEDWQQHAEKTAQAIEIAIDWQ